MKALAGRRGSALLIVLGMLSFMVVSAVGFSVYMRASRTPSSYLRRNLSSRYLVRAALAKAIGELDGAVNTIPNWGGVDSGADRDSSEDRASSVPYRKPGGGSGGTGSPFYGIYDDPYPGVLAGDDTSDRARSGDFWAGRVFMPFGSLTRPKANETYRQEPTVPVLTLEALAYLPPAIINDVRYFARRTRTACWRQLPYDSGRYAYCAVDVSDLFDINRLRADVARDSGPNRITLTSLCAKQYDDMLDPAASQSDAGDLDNILAKGVPVPFTSLADFNFVAGSGSPFAPFMKSVFGGSGTFDPVNALFITDTWFPPKETAEAGTVYDLTSLGGQPFKLYTASSVGAIGSQTKGVLNMDGNVGELYERNLGMGLACLYDYLDGDSKPSSLALPTVEAVPMVVGVSVPGAPGLSPELAELSEEEIEISNISGTAVPIGSTDNTPEQVGNIVVKRKVKLFGVKSLGERAEVKVVVANPFKRLASENRAKTYYARGLIRVWLAPAGMGCRPKLGPDVNNLYPNRETDWQNGIAKNGVATFLSDASVSLGFGGDIATASDAIKEVTLRFSNLDVNMPIYYKVDETPVPPAGYKEPLTPSDPEKSWKTGGYNSFGNVGTMDAALRPLNLDGGVDDDWQSVVDAAKNGFNKDVAYPKGMAEFDATAAFATKQYRVYAAVWVQIMDGSGPQSPVVDMVPACLLDDVDWLRADESILDLTPVMKKTGTSDGTPILNFVGDQDVSFGDIGKLASAVTYDNGWKGLYAVDPRYNFAPEDWYSSSSSASMSEWLPKLTSTILGRDGRDHDIFMFVSDQEYLQSIGELQFLPMLNYLPDDLSSCGLSGRDDFDAGVYNPNFHGEQFSTRTGPDSGNFANGVRFWRTYSAYPVGTETRREFEDRKKNPYKMLNSAGKQVTMLSGTGGFKLNPFSRDDRVICAALAGTPVDYYVASTNTRLNSLVENMTLAKMINKHSFGSNSRPAMSKKFLSEVAEVIKERFEDNADDGSADWIDAWDSLMWQENVSNCIDENNKSFIANDMENTLSEALHGVDRKFLYSFWRDCFDNRQQLFLIFVRAEPTSVGGGGMSRASSQLGGRAVALVWRDPNPPTQGSRPQRKNITSRSEDIRPHRTRVLFYHQFD